MPTFRYGQIVVPDMVDPNGVNPKDRPVVVVSPPEEIVEGDPLRVVAITTLLPGPVPPHYVRLPWDRRGHPRTGLKTNCAAVCSWLTRVKPDGLRPLGFVPGRQLHEIAETLKVLHMGRSESSESSGRDPSGDEPGPATNSPIP